MSFSRVQVWAANCGGCGADWWTSTAEARPTFESQLEARKALVEVYGWQIQRDAATGRTTMHCSVCKTRTECEIKGCDPNEPLLPDGRLRTCTRCCRVIRIDSPSCEPAPSGALPEVLADLEARFFEEARR